MESYKVNKTLKEFRERLAQYPPTALREVKRSLQKIEAKYGISYDPGPEAADAAEKELLIAQYREMDATDAEIEAMLSRWGF
jgi:RNA polymerase-binding transcription factor DksA